MAALAQQLAELNAAPESFDPADIDEVLDDTAARKKRKKSKSGLANDDQLVQPEKGRLAMRQKMPVLPKYSGNKVSRKDIFSDQNRSISDANDDLPDDSDGDDIDEDLKDVAELGASLGDMANFSISADLEKEYEKMMKKSHAELSLLRTPSAAERSKKEQEAKQLKTQASIWSALVEFRIHLESALGLAHRLPAGKTRALVNDVGGEQVSKDVDAVAGEASELLGVLLDLQHSLAEKRGISTADVDDAMNAPHKKRRVKEADSWALVDAQMQPVADWGLGIADEWKERTRLDARRSFKVLDQSLSTQMRAASDVEPEKLRRRCMPPPGRHKVFGASAITEADKSEGVEEESDIFDDREFYVQLLREVLASGGGNKLGDEQSKGLQAELQGRRASKKRNKAEVERRASKGRKIRYVAVEKLQNFMAARPRASEASAASVDPLIGGEHAIDALLRSLFSSAKGS